MQNCNNLSFQASTPDLILPPRSTGAIAVLPSAVAEQVMTSAEDFTGHLLALSAHEWISVRLLDLAAELWIAEFTGHFLGFRRKFSGKHVWLFSMRVVRATISSLLLDLYRRGEFIAGHSNFNDCRVIMIHLQRQHNGIGKREL